MQRGDEEAELLSRIAQIPRGTWLVDARSLFRIKDVLEATEGSDKPVLFVGYNAPNRDNGGASAGGAGTLESYERWYTQVREAIGDRKVDFVVEPDALGFAWQSKDPEERKRWVTSVRSAVEVLRESPNIRIFIDATHPDWVPPEEMAALLKEAGILEAPGQVGFAVNVANFQPLGDCEDYVDAIRAELGDEEGIIPAIIDTSRNGNEDLYVQQVVDPDGTVALGVPPQKLGGNMTAAYVKDPSEGDGRRFGAGELIPQRLGEFARNAANLGVEGIEKLVDKV
jgi:endoglucanase